MYNTNNKVYSANWIQYKMYKYNIYETILGVNIREKKG